jgi:imidazolonepropionase-like amidohydrolase
MVDRAFAVMKRTVKRMHDEGVRLHSGTDTLVAFVVPGAALHRELRIYVDAGMTPEEALAISMRDSAADLGVPGLGEIRAGAPADLLVFREDPTRSLDALDSLAAVIRDGRPPSARRARRAARALPRPLRLAALRRHRDPDRAPRARERAQVTIIAC